MVASYWNTGIRWSTFLNQTVHVLVMVLWQGDDQIKVWTQFVGMDENVWICVCVCVWVWVLPTLNHDKRRQADIDVRTNIDSTRVTLRFRIIKNNKKKLTKSLRQWDTILNTNISFYFSPLLSLLYVRSYQQTTCSINVRLEAMKRLLLTYICTSKHGLRDK